MLRFFIYDIIVFRFSRGLHFLSQGVESAKAILLSVGLVLAQFFTITPTA